MAKIAPSLIVVATFTAVIVAGFWAFVIPEVKLLNDIHLKAEDGLKLEASHLTSVRPTPTPNLAAQKNTRDQVLALIPPTDDQYVFTGQVEALSKNMGIALTSFNIAAAAPSATPAATKGTGEDAAPGAKTPSPVASAVPAVTLKKLSFILSFSSSYQDAQRFVSALPTLDRYVQVGQVVMTSNTGDQVATQVTASAYYLPSSGPAS
jgi:hypothetical protein